MKVISKETIGKIYTVLLTMYILASLFMAQAVYNKLIFATLIMIYGAYLLFLKDEKKISWVTFAPIVIITIFAYGFIRGIFNSMDFALAKQFLLTTSILLLIYPIEEFGINVNALLRKIAPVYLVLYGIYVVYGINIMEYDLPVFVEKICALFDNGLTRAIAQIILKLDAGAGGIKYRSYFSGVGMMIHLGSTPFIFILTNVCFIDFLENRKIMGLLWTILGVVISYTTGSRALMLLMAVSICILIVLKLEDRQRLVVITLCCVVGMAAFLYLLRNSTFFSLDESSNSAKIADIVSYFKQLNLKQALLGDGLATYYYTTAVDGYLAHTEITLMDYWRYFGIPLGSVVYGALFFPKKNTNWNLFEMKPETAVFLMYLLFSQTNPVLFNSFGLVSALWYWDVLFRRKNEFHY